MIIQGYVKEKFPLAYDYFESYGWKYCPISYKNLWGWKKQLEKGSLGMVIFYKLFFKTKLILILHFKKWSNLSLTLTRNRPKKLNKEKYREKRNQRFA